MYIYLREETIHTPVFHSRKFTYTYPPSAIHTTLSPTKRIRATINMGVGTSREDEEKEEVEERVVVVVECRRSCGYTVDI